MENKSYILMQRYELGRQLGKGNFAKVYYARSLITNQAVAIKVIDKEKILKNGLMDQIKREISVMRMVRHPNVIHLYEVLATKTKIYFVIEYAKGGELFNKVAKGRLKEDVARKYFQQLINALDFCHSRGVYHRDIKPENLLLDEKDNLKISDFGLSAIADCKRQDGLLHTTCGTPAYVAPEVINMKGYDGVKADVWSCGVVLFVLLAAYLPFHDSNLMEMYRKIGKAEFRCPNFFSPEARRLLSKMLDPNPSTRISLAKVRESSWYKRGSKSKEKEVAAAGTEASSPSENNVAAETNQESGRPSNLNAFDIISLSDGFDLSSLFEKDSLHKEARFTSRETASVIISKLEEMARHLKLKVSKRENGLFKMDAQQEGKKGILSIDAEIFEITPAFHVVEVKKLSGDSFEYQTMLQDMRPALRDIVWVWQGDLEQTRQEQQQQEQEQEEMQEQSQQLPQNQLQL